MDTCVLASHSFTHSILHSFPPSFTPSFPPSLLPSFPPSLIHFLLHSLSQNADVFYHQLLLYLGAFVGGIPVFVFRDYYQGKLTLNWRGWMTQHLLKKYMADRTYYRLGSAGSALVDNPDQR